MVSQESLFDVLKRQAEQPAVVFQRKLPNRPELTETEKIAAAGIRRHEGIKTGEWLIFNPDGSLQKEFIGSREFRFADERTFDQRNVYLHGDRDVEELFWIGSDIAINRVVGRKIFFFPGTMYGAGLFLGGSGGTETCGGECFFGVDDQTLMSVGCVMGPTDAGVLGIRFLSVIRESKSGWPNPKWSEVLGTGWKCTNEIPDWAHWLTNTKTVLHKMFPDISIQTEPDWSFSLPLSSSPGLKAFNMPDDVLVILSSDTFPLTFSFLLKESSSVVVVQQAVYNSSGMLDYFSYARIQV
eukprot:CAMPEP_0196666690 /NCGR_PEP_ID=MMETSP1086-20130531/64657_1 /TAXON_ID=77921 /ORGANISM="Cyanoptyche  gloeocystis , Strain SAG4.97" /LENGTH=296 /DNA_ID=CAMNT_0042003915 /DNA_START=202 /DNA_END=1092 /DNA_ORIENTATION=-